MENFRESLQRLLNTNEYHAIRAIPYEGRSKDAAERIAKGCLEIVTS